MSYDSSFLILGYGYTSSFLVPQLSVAYPDAEILTTSRSQPKMLHFNLDRPSTWKNLPDCGTLIWTFPPKPFMQVQAFSDFYKGRYKKALVIGSTSSLTVEQPNQRVDETTPLDFSLERARCEELLRKQGFRLLLSSGIYGPGRNPLVWIKRDMVGISDKLVNMIHVNDLCQFIIKSIEMTQPGTLLIASDNNPQSWRTLIRYWQEMGTLGEVPLKESERPSKHIDASETLRRLEIELQHPSFRDSVMELG